MLDLSGYPTLNYARQWSVKTLKQMEDLLKPVADRNPDVLIVAPSGSIGRLEGMGHSDCDLIVLIKHEAVKDKRRSGCAMQDVWNALEPLGLPMPKSSGIYSTPASQEQICDYSTLGQVADDKDVFGKRLQILLDSTPVYGHVEFNNLRYALLERYAAGFLANDQRKEWVYLLNDLIRYLRSYCSWHQFDLSHDPIDSWYMRNVKLRNGRIPMFAALIFLLGECSKETQDKIGWLHKHLHLTMMQRIEFVYRMNDDSCFGEFIAPYEFFMEQMNRKEVREKLVTTTPATLDELNRTSLPDYETLRRNSNRILSELTRFTLERRGQWSDAFFEYLLF